jgi:DNA recombination protein RmuC
MMSMSTFLVAFVLGLAVTAVVALYSRQRLVADRARLDAELSDARRRIEDERATHAASQAQMKDAFSALSQDALRENRKDFMLDATTLLGPVKDALGRVQSHLAEVDKAREGSFRDVAARLGSLAQTQEHLRLATEGLTRSLRSPNVRGKWGEVQLQRIVELSGMLEHCDFDVQVLGADEDVRLRPDLVVHLPGGSHIVIDAKVPIDAYMRIADAPDESARARALDDHAAQVKGHIRALGAKKYWDQFNPAPEFVVMFLPLEPLLSAAFEREGDLLEFAVKEHVVLATPMTLFALLRAVAFGWQQHAIARNTEAIQDAGRELCDRLVKLVEHFDRVGQGVQQAMKAYNEAVASFNSRVMPSVKRFQELQVPNASALAPLSTRDVETREITKPELPGLGEEEEEEELTIGDRVIDD